MMMEITAAIWRLQRQIRFARTSTTHNATLDALKGAGEICQRLADQDSAIVQKGRQVAWLSDSKTNASGRIDHALALYNRTEGMDIALMSICIQHVAAGNGNERANRG